MAVAPHPSIYVSLGVAALIGWRLYMRVRRMVGRQQFKPRRPWFTVTLFPLLLAVLLFASLTHPASALALVSGAALGVALGMYGLHLTRFEATSQGMFYTPNAHLGIALSLLFIGRVLYRVAQFWWVNDAGPGDSTQFMHSPITLAIFGTLAGYYVTYAVGLLRWQRRVAGGVSADVNSAPPPP